MLKALCKTHPHKIVYKKINKKQYIIVVTHTHIHTERYNMTSTCILLLSPDSSHCITHNANSKAPLIPDDVCKKVNQNISKKLDYKSYLHNQYIRF